MAAGDKALAPPGEDMPRGNVAVAADAALSILRAFNSTIYATLTKAFVVRLIRTLPFVSGRSYRKNFNKSLWLFSFCRG
jgi:hypothetical protein